MSERRWSGSGGRARPRWPEVLHGWVRLAAWGIVLTLLRTPWRQLGGVVPEPLRWWARAASWGALIVGYCTGGLLRDRTDLGSPGRVSWLRALLLLPSAVLAPTLVLLHAVGREPQVNLAVSTLVAWCAGVDLALHVVPRLRAGSARPGDEDGAEDDELDP